MTDWTCWSVADVIILTVGTPTLTAMQQQRAVFADGQHANIGVFLEYEAAFISILSKNFPQVHPASLAYEVENVTVIRSLLRKSEAEQQT